MRNKSGTPTKGARESGRLCVFILMAGIVLLSWPLACATSQEQNATDQSEEIRDDFDSQCAESNRSYSATKDPELYFFSSADHGRETSGCNPSKGFSLSLKRDSGADIEGNPDEWQLEKENMTRILFRSQLYNSSLPTYMLVHGFLSSWDGDTWMCALKDRILNETAANVFIVDWSGGSKPMLPIDYGAAVANTKYVGQLLAKFVSDLLTMSGQSDASRFHLIGHSLGAHISGFVGYALNGKSLGRITGLDPAGPCFTGGKRKNSPELRQSGELSRGRLRLSAGCADLVVALHTDAGKFGLDENCAHYDVYVNGGRSQPTCVGQSLLDRVDNLLELRLSDAINVKDIVCSHGYSHKLTEHFLPAVFKERARFSAHAPSTSSYAPSNGSEQVAARRHRRSLEEKNDEKELLEAAEGQCWLVAHRCTSWAAFKRGECGLAAPADSGARDASRAIDVFNVNPVAGPRFAKQAAAAALSTAASAPPLRSESLLDGPTEADDEHVNGEEGNELQSSNVLENSQGKSENWQHFIRTSRDKSQASVCAYTYQLVIATTAMAAEKDVRKYYLSLPLANELGLANAKPMHARADGVPDRLVQVSHRVEAESWAWSQLSKLFGPLFGLASETNELSYYTALITFDAAAADECRQLLASNRTETHRKRWFLCQPLSRLDGALLWSADESLLATVRAVGIVYLSGPDTVIRRDKSYLLAPDLSQVTRGPPNEEATSTSLSDGERGGLANRLVSGVKRGLKCLLFNLDACRRGGPKLRYSAPLREASAEAKNLAIQV